MVLERIQQVLGEYAPSFQLTSPAEVRTYRGFSGAEVFRLPTAAGEFALRRWPGGTLNFERVCGLHRLLGWIAQSGVRQVAVPAAAANGATVVSLESGYWQLEPWKPGTADFHDKPSRDKLAAAMRVLAEWHRAAATFIPRDNECEWFRCEAEATSPAVHERLEKLHTWMSGRLRRLEQAVDVAPADPMRDLTRDVIRNVNQHAPRIANELRRLTTHHYRLQPCLRDIWHDHVLFSGSEVTGIIDPSACRLENIATDLARLLGSLVEDDTQSWNFAVETYHQCNPLFDAEWELMRTLDRSTVLLSGLYWADRKYLRGVQFRDETAVLDRLRGIVCRGQSLTG